MGRRRSGFILLEVLGALVVVMIFFGAIFSSMNGVRRMEKMSRRILSEIYALQRICAARSGGLLS